LDIGCGTVRWNRHISPDLCLATSWLHDLIYYGTVSGSFSGSFNVMPGLLKYRNSCQLDIGYIMVQYLAVLVVVSMWCQAFRLHVFSRIWVLFIAVHQKVLLAQFAKPNWFRDIAF
jgi:hypothetical protein